MKSCTQIMMVLIVAGAAIANTAALYKGAGVGAAICAVMNAAFLLVVIYRLRERSRLCAVIWKFAFGVFYAFIALMAFWGIAMAIPYFIALERMDNADH